MVRKAKEHHLNNINFHDLLNVKQLDTKFDIILFWGFTSHG